MADKNYICGVVEGFYGRPWTTEQRKHLFSQLKRLGMNTYLYAPKDDLKHRAEWRLLYTAEEAALLESLIKTATENGITFVYALSPGIDIVYSSAKEIKNVKDKLNQVRSLGCTAFSLLFDDIETSMNELDRKQFSSFAHAQISVTNAVYEFFSYPLFLFCPTEYCESSASPSLEESEYLSTLSRYLHPEIHILWTGPRVVSRFLTVEHLQKVANALRRKPMIWDNLHANDYDPKRIFMGPFVGRPVAIKNETSGLLLNPNCKYEANHVPLFTLSDWVQSDLDAPKIEEDQNVVLESTVSEEATRIVERSKSTRLYHPLTSLRRALNNWLPHFRAGGPSPSIPPLSHVETQAIAPVIDPNAVSSSEVPPPTIRTCEGNEMLGDLPPPIYTSPIGRATTVTVQAFPLSEAIIGVVEAHDSALISKAPQTVNSLTVDYNEPMDIPVPVNKEDIAIGIENRETLLPMDMGTETVPVQVENVMTKHEEDALWRIDLDDIALFVDIFYLPFENGRKGIEILYELKWLYQNAPILRTNDLDGKECEEWHRRFDNFKNLSCQLTELYRNLIKSPNKSLLQEIFPYLWEAQGLFSVLCALLEWMRKGNLLILPNEMSHWCPDEIDPDSEPWALGGGLLPDLQKLMVSSPKVGEIFTVKFAIPLSLRCYTIRPVDLSIMDKVLLYNLFACKKEREFAEIIMGAENPNGLSPEEYFFDRTFAPFLKYGTPSHHFAAESEVEEDGKEELCSLGLAILNVAGVADDFRDVFMAKFKEKYGLDEQREQNMEEDDLNESSIQFWKTDEEKLISPFQFSDDFLVKYQSFIEIRSSDSNEEAVSIRRLLHCLSASLALNGSAGFFTIIPSHLKEKINLLTKLGLQTIEHADFEHLNHFTLMGHLL